MVRIATYRSRKLRVNEIEIYPAEFFSAGGFDLEEILASSEPCKEIDNSIDKRLTRKQKKALKKQIEEAKRIKENKLYELHGEEIFEEDLTDEELAEIKASEIINQDCFYDALMPIDDGEEAIEQEKRKDRKTMLILGTVISITVFIGLMIFMLYKMASGIV